MHALILLSATGNNTHEQRVYANADNYFASSKGRLDSTASNDAAVYAVDEQGTAIGETDVIDSPVYGGIIFVEQRGRRTSPNKMASGVRQIM